VIAAHRRKLRRIAHDEHLAALGREDMLQEVLQQLGLALLIAPDHAGLIHDEQRSAIAIGRHGDAAPSRVLIREPVDAAMDGAGGLLGMRCEHLGSTSCRRQ
jgi:hypothetical protein